MFVHSRGDRQIAAEVRTWQAQTVQSRLADVSTFTTTSGDSIGRCQDRFDISDDDILEFMLISISLVGFAPAVRWGGLYPFRHAGQDKPAVNTQVDAGNVGRLV